MQCKMWTEIILLILGIPALVVYIIVRIKMSKSIKSIDVTANMPIIENDYRSEFTDSYSLGIIKSINLRKNGCYLIEMYPIDVEQGEDVVRPHLQSFVVKKEFYKPFSIGELSGRRSRIKTVTRDNSKIPEKMRDTTEGKWVSKEGQLAHLENTFGKAAITGGDEAIAAAMKEFARGNITEAALQEMKAAVKIIKDIAVTNPDKEGKKS